MGDFNALMFDHIKNEAKFDKFMAVGLLNDPEESITISQFYDSENVINIHGDNPGKKYNFGDKYLSAMDKICFMVGRMAGLSPEIPGTFKDLDYDFEGELTAKERKDFLKAGVMHTKFDTDFEQYIIHQSISTLQDNKQFIASDGQSYEHSVTRIGFQLNKILYLKAKFTFLRAEDGVNRFSADTNTMEQFTIKALKDETATTTESGLILYSEGVKAKIVGDGIYTQYSYEPNYPLNKLFFTGFQLDRNL